MRQVRTAVLIFLFITPGLAQEKKLIVNGAITTDYVRNISGGIERGGMALGILDLGATWRPAAGLLKHTEFHTRILRSKGGEPSADLIGDVQSASNIEGKTNRLIYELWMKQSLGDFFILAGFHDLNSEFFVTDLAADFLNGSFGISPGIALNVPASLYPVTTAGAAVGYQKGRTDVCFGVYNLNHRFSEAGAFAFSDHDFAGGHFAIGEFRYGLSAEEGMVKTGVYAKRCRTPRYDDVDECLSAESYGYYALVEKGFVKFNEAANLNVFLQWSGHPGRKSYVSAYIGGGLVLDGQGKNSSLGLAFASAQFNRAGDLFGDRQAETSVELFYRRVVSDFLTLQPDAQYIINPAGQAPGSFVLAFRVNFTGAYQK